jgi:hypothetical protein
VRGSAKVTYEQKLAEVKTGIDNVLRFAYTNERKGGVDFTLDQTDDTVLEQISGMSASVVTAGSVINYQFGTVDLSQLALLLVVQNKLDGKEWQFYNPNAFFDFSFEDSNDAMGLKIRVPSFRTSARSGRPINRCSPPPCSLNSRGTDLEPTW